MTSAAIQHELGWLEHEDHAEPALVAELVEVLRRRRSVGSRRIAATAELIIATIGPLSCWLVHGKPPTLDTELLIDGVGRMLRGLLDP